MDHGIIYICEASNIHDFAGYLLSQINFVKLCARWRSMAAPLRKILPYICLNSRREKRLFSPKVSLLIPKEIDETGINREARLLKSRFSPCAGKIDRRFPRSFFILQAPLIMRFIANKNRRKGVGGRSTVDRQRHRYKETTAKSNRRLNKVIWYTPQQARKGLREREVVHRAWTGTEDEDLGSYE